MSRHNHPQGASNPAQSDQPQDDTAHLAIPRSLPATVDPLWPHQMDAVFAATTDGLVLVDANGCLLRSSPFAATILCDAGGNDPTALSAHDRNQVRLRNPRTLVGVPLPSQEMPLSRLLDGQVLASTDALELLVQAADGEDVVLQVTGNPVYDVAGRLVGAVAVFRDETERWHVDSEARATLGAVRAAAEDVQHAAANIASGGGSTPAHASALSRIADHLLTVSRGVMAVQQRTRRVLDRRRRIQERAQAKSAAFEEAHRRMREFLDIASHELRTPLTAIKTSLQLTSRRLDVTRLHERDADGLRQIMVNAQASLDQADKGVNRLSRLVNDLLDVSRIKSGQLELQRELCDLGTIVRDAVQQQRQQHPKRRITVEAPRKALLVEADADRIEQVITNYLTNAVRYAPADRPIVVRLEAESAHARVSVQDEGPGLPPSQQELVWDMFHRVPDVVVHSGPGGGLGLGLHISRTIVERHGGQVGVWSAPGRGSTFWFSLPLGQ